MTETASGEAIRHRMAAERACTAAESAAETASANVSTPASATANQYQLCSCTRSESSGTACLGDRRQRSNAKRSYDGEYRQAFIDA
jgi:hypothetical protein